MTFPLTTPPDRVLIVRMSHLGDIAQTIPLVHGLRAKWPSVRLAWALQPEFATLIQPLVDEVIPFGRRDGVRAWPAIRRAMARFSPDLAIDAQGNWKSAAAARLSGAPLCVGFAPAHWQEPMAARVFGIRAPLPPESALCASARGSSAGWNSVHLVERVLGLAEAITGSAATRLDAGVTREERWEANRLIASSKDKVGPGSPIQVVLHPGAPGDPRSWPRESYRNLARRLLDSGQRVLVLTGPAECTVGKWMKTEVPEAAHIVGQRGLRSLAALFDVLHKGGAQLVSGDSGPSHLAASAGLPVVLIAGPEDPARTGPWPVPAPFASPSNVAAGDLAARPTLTSPHRVAGAPSGGSDSGSVIAYMPRPIEDTTVDCVIKALTLE